MIYFATNKALREEVKQLEERLEKHDNFRAEQYYDLGRKHLELEVRFERLMDYLGLHEYKQYEPVIVKKGITA